MSKKGTSINYVNQKKFKATHYFNGHMQITFKQYQDSMQKHLIDEIPCKKIKLLSLAITFTKNNSILKTRMTSMWKYE